MTESPPLTIAVVLHYRGVMDTLACVRSLLRARYGNLRTLVVDNGSGDHIADAVREMGADVLTLPENLGFAGGNNAGVREAQAQRPSYLLLLNNDTLVDPDFLQPLVSSMEADPGLAATTGTILFYPETDRIWYGGGSLAPWRATAVVKRGPSRPVRESPAPLRVSFVSGCALLVRASVIESLGLFDERYFMYVEDVEFSHRCQQHGHRLLYVPGSIIYHKSAHRDATAPPLYFMIRNRLLFAASSLRGATKLLAIATVLGITLLKLPMWAMRGRRLAAAALAGVVDFLRGRWGMGRGFQFSHRHADAG